MKNIIEYLNEGFFSNVRGSLSDVKKLLAPIFEMSNPKKYLNKNTVYDVLVKLPEKFGGYTKNSLPLHPLSDSDRQAH